MQLERRRRDPHKYFHEGVSPQVQPAQALSRGLWVD